MDLAVLLPIDALARYPKDMGLHYSQRRAVPDKSRDWVSENVLERNYTNGYPGNLSKLSKSTRVYALFLLLKEINDFFKKFKSNEYESYSEEEKILKDFDRLKESEYQLDEELLITEAKKVKISSTQMAYWAQEFCRSNPQMTSDNEFMEMYKNYDKVIHSKDLQIEYEKRFHKSFCEAAKEPMYNQHILKNLS